MTGNVWPQGSSLISIVAGSTVCAQDGSPANRTSPANIGARDLDWGRLANLFAPQLTPEEVEPRPPLLEQTRVAADAVALAGVEHHLEGLGALLQGVDDAGGVLEDHV